MMTREELIEESGYVRMQCPACKSMFWANESRYCKFCQPKEKGRMLEFQINDMRERIKEYISNYATVEETQGGDWVIVYREGPMERQAIIELVERIREVAAE